MRILRELWLKITRPAALVAWLGTGAKPCSEFEARRRARICEHCPANLRPASFTAVLGEGVEAAMKLKNGLKLTVPNEHRLNSCAACGCKLSVKIWVPYEHIKSYQQTEETKLLREANLDCWQL